MQDVIHNENIKLDWFFKYSLIKDLAAVSSCTCGSCPVRFLLNTGANQGMEYLHESPLECHGRLKSSNCVIDGRWALKVTDYGLVPMRTQLKEAKRQLINSLP